MTTATGAGAHTVAIMGRALHVLLSGWLNPVLLLVGLPCLVLVIMWLNVLTQPLVFVE